ncbi:hypothetical protein AB0A77_34080 [Streptomyces varsoviensis]|uniref:hypothetical protein n=1 Tax=Streptomyces varsoviensis TaxID=67373 RepID=UPI0033E2AF81
MSRHKQLAVLLSRAERGVLTPDEAAALRTAVAELAADRDRLARDVAAAERDIVEAEQRTEQAEQQLAAIRVELEESHRRRNDARADRRNAEHEARRAEDTLARTRKQLAEAEETSLRYARHLAAAQRACGAPDWPTLAATIRDRTATPA